jgi:hypothetical protein
MLGVKSFIAQRNASSQSGIFNPRVLIAFALCSVATLLAMLGLAASTAPSPLPGGSFTAVGSMTLARYYHTRIPLLRKFPQYLKKA